MEHGLVNGTETPPPANALRLGQEHANGEYFCAVANSEWGRIPGKAKNGKCWYSYGGNEYETEDFDLVTYPITITTVANDGNGPPPGARPIGNQHTAGEQYGVIANTEWGRVPGKAVDNICWYPYGGEEHTGQSFEWIICTAVRDSDQEQMNIDFIQQPEPPENGLKFGYQNDGAGDLWVAVAETEWGKIPGKAKDGTCWYSFNGKEYDTDVFHYVVYTSPHKFIHNNDSGPPKGALPVGNQTDGRGDQYAAIANTEWGRIPGKADGNSCWYPCNGQEHETQDFDWIVFKNL